MPADLGKLGEAFVEIRASLDKLDADLNKADSQISRKLTRLGDSLTGIGSKMTLGITVPIAAFGALALKASGDFEASMNRVQAVSGATAVQFGELREKAKDLGATTQFSASQAADAMGFLAMAGFDANKILGSMDSTLQLAAAAALDLGQAADITSNILTGFGKDVSELAHVNDVLVGTVTKTNTDMVQLGDAMKYVAPIASAAGLSIEETSAAIGMLGNAGIQASMAGTTLRGSITGILDPSKEASDIMKELGLKLTDSSGRLVSFSDILEQLAPHAQNAALFVKLFGDRAGPGMQALVSQGSDALRGLTGELTTLQGTAKEIAEVQMKGFNGAMKELKSAFEALQIAIGDSGLLEFAAGLTRELAGFIRELSKTNPEILKWGASIAGVAALIGPLLVSLGFLLKGLAGLAPVISGASKALTALKVAMLSANEASLLLKGGLIGVAVGIAALNTKAAADSIRAMWTEQKTLNELLKEGKENSMGFTDVLFPIPKILENISRAILVVKEAWQAYKTEGLGGVIDAMMGLEQASSSVISELDQIRAAQDMASDSHTRFAESVASIEPEMNKLTDAYLDGKISAEEYAAEKEKLLDEMAKMRDGLPPVVKSLKSLADENDEAAKKLKALKDQMQDALKPADNLEKEIVALLREGFSKHQIIAVYGEKIAEAAKAHRLLNGEVPETVGELEKMYDLLRPLSQQMHEASQDFSEAEQAMTKASESGSYLDSVIGGLSQTTGVNESVLKDQIAATLKQKAALEGTGDVALETSAAIEEWSSKIIENSKTMKENSEFSKQWSAAWSQAMGQVLDRFTTWVSDMLGISNGFVKTLLEIFVQNLFNPLFSWFGRLSKAFGDWLGSLLPGGGSFSLGGALKNAVGIGGAAVLSTGGAAAAGGAVAGAGLGGGTIGAVGVGGGLSAAGWIAPTGAEAAGTAAGSSFMSGLTGFLTNPITIAAAGAALGGWQIYKFLKDPFRLASKEIGRDFAVDVSKSAVDTWASGLGISKNELEPFRKSILGSPKAFEDILLPAAKAASSVESLIESYSEFKVSADFAGILAQSTLKYSQIGKDFLVDLSDQARQAIEGNFAALNDAFIQLQQNSGLGQMYEDLSRFLSATIDATKATEGLDSALSSAATTAGTLNPQQTSIPVTGNEPVGLFSGYYAKAMKWYLEKGNWPTFSDLKGAGVNIRGLQRGGVVEQTGLAVVHEGEIFAPLSKIVAELGELMASSLSRGMESIASLRASAMMGTGAMVASPAGSMGVIRPEAQREALRQMTINNYFNVQSRSEDLVRTTREEVIPLFMRELRSGRGGHLEDLDDMLEKVKPI